MFKLASLTQKQARIRESRMSTSGYAAWVVWTDQLTEAIPHTFQDYGGMPMVEESNQALWFFFTTDVFKAMARLQVWAKLNELPVFIQVFQTQLKVGFQLEGEIAVPTDLNAQEALKPDEFQIWVHTSCFESADGIPGIKLNDAKPYSGLAQGPWAHLAADARLGYESGLGWYGVLRPLGNPLDKNFAEGWRNFYHELEGVLERLKLKYLFSENSLIFALNDYRTMRTWCLEILALIKSLKNLEEDSPYWPSVMVVTEKKNLNFNEELPSKIHIDWEQMAPDFPHTSYRTAFMLGDRFKIKDVSFSLERSQFTDWCYIHLADVEEEQGGSLPVVMPAALVAGSEHPCFYCGLRNHKPAECPSRDIKELNPGVWKRLSRSSLEKINEKFEDVGRQVEKEPLPALKEQIESKESGSELTRAIYEINSPVQLRMAPVVWRSVGKEFPEAFSKLAPPDKENVSRSILQTMLDGDNAGAERMARDHAFKNPGDYQPRVLQGFIAMEKGDLEKAQSVWREAQHLGGNPFHQCYLLFLQARLKEIDYKFDSAMGLYKQAQTHSPKWSEPRYRQAVCMVKMGFTEHALSIFDQLIAEDPAYFNRIIIDPELERGAIQILSHLWEPWTGAQSQAEEAVARLDEFSKEVDDWFGEDSEFGEEIKKRAAKLKELGNVENYVAFKRLIGGHAALTRELRKRVENESRRLSRKAQEYTNELQRLHDEISWFPFPKALREFNKDFNYCATRVNWVKTQHYGVAENFKKSRRYFEKVDKKIEKLGKHLVTLRIVRDATLFMLMLGKSFMWYEIIGLGLALALVPVIIYFAEASGSAWAQQLLIDQRWSLQKGLIIVLSLLAFTAALLRNAMAFEKRKSKFFSKYKDKEPEIAAKRIKKARAKREKRLQKAAAARKKAAAK